jgi:signal transduction histidine kinase
MSRVPLRLRLTAAFALAMLVLLAVTALFLHLRLKDDLDEQTNAALESRTGDLAALAGRGPLGAGAALDPEESFAQVLGRDGRLIGSSGGVRGAVLTPEEVGRARARPLVVERRVRGIEGVARIRAQRAADPALVVVAGVTLEERDETLSGQVASFAVGGPIAVLLASLAGYLLAGIGLRPVEAMRSRAERVSLGGADERLPLPEANDEIRRLGLTLNEMLARLRASFERERRFVADASHELRTPLAVLKTELEAALRGSVDDDAREGLRAALDEIDHLAQLADDLLLLAHAGEGRLRVQPEDVDVRELLERSCERFADRAREHGREIVVDAPPGLRARLDPLRMRQALGNLVDNALRHGEGRIVLRAGETWIEVSDEGPGFPADVREHAFERFARGSAGRTGGSGLGLAIVRAIAEAHGGGAEIAPGGAVRLSWGSHPRDAR